jgi:hypothetical protein
MTTVIVTDILCPICKEEYLVILHKKATICGCQNCKRIFTYPELVEKNPNRVEEEA